VRNSTSREGLPQKAAAKASISRPFTCPIERAFYTTTMSEEEERSKIVKNETLLTELVGHIKQYKQLVEGKFRNKYGDVAWGDAKASTFADFVDRYADGDVNIMTKLEGWIAYYQLENRFKPPGQPNGKLRCCFCILVFK
jgi:hypothetical protein